MIIKKAIRKIGILSIIVAMIFAVGCGTSNLDANGSSENQITCTVEIDCNNIVQNQEGIKDGVKKIIPNDGVILKRTEVTVDQGDSIFDATKKVCKDNKISFIYEGKDDTAYVKGIANIFEKDAGKTSGWLCEENNKALSKSAGATKVEEGSEIHWGYVKNYKDEI